MFLSSLLHLKKNWQSIFLFAYFSHFACSYMLVFCSSLSPITSILMACLFITCLHTRLFAHCLHVHCFFACHLPMSFVHHSLSTCATYVAYSLHVYVTCSSPTCITYPPTCRLLRYPPNLLFVHHMLPCSLPPSMWYCPLTYMCKF